MGLDFFCHKTVYTGKPAESPLRDPSEFKSCLGGMKHRDKVSLRRAAEHRRRMKTAEGRGT